MMFHFLSKTILTILVIFLSCFITIDAKKNSASKTVYIYFKTNANQKYYYAEKHIFYQKLFGKEFNVVLTTTLQNLINFDYIITDEVPRNDEELSFLATYPKEKVLLFSFEPPLIETRSQDQHYHHYYSKIFTWFDDLIDNKNYFKIRFPWMDPQPIIANRPTFDQKKLCALVAGNLTSHEPFAGYSHRKNIIDFFEKLQTNEFDLYGKDWEQLSCYRGPIPERGNRRLNKINILKNYKFDLCYENVRLNGWVSERIFEAFAAGCVPVYWGTNNIENYVPRGCFINRENFNTNEELYTFLKNMSQEEYELYIANIQNFLSSDNAYSISTPHYISCIRRALNLRMT